MYRFDCTADVMDKANAVRLWTVCLITSVVLPWVDYYSAHTKPDKVHYYSNKRNVHQRY